jgi:hypothetical protein
MNCKQGDLAIIVRGGNLGRLVQVIEPSDPLWAEAPDWWYVEVLGPPAIGGGGVLSNFGHISDKHLKPLRGEPGEDETLQWTPVPHKETA